MDNTHTLTFNKVIKFGRIMESLKSTINNEDGMVLIACILIISILTISGLAATRVSKTEALIHSFFEEAVHDAAVGCAHLVGGIRCRCDDLTERRCCCPVGKVDDLALVFDNAHYVRAHRRIRVLEPRPGRRC